MTPGQTAAVVELIKSLRAGAAPAVAAGQQGLPPPLAVPNPPPRLPIRVGPPGPTRAVPSARTGPDEGAPP
jgi:hypothetical protein